MSAKIKIDRYKFNAKILNKYSDTYTNSGAEHLALACAKFIGGASLAEVNAKFKLTFTRSEHLYNKTIEAQGEALTSVLKYLDRNVETLLADLEGMSRDYTVSEKANRKLEKENEKLKEDVAELNLLVHETTNESVLQEKIASDWAIKFKTIEDQNKILRESLEHDREVNLKLSTTCRDSAFTISHLSKKLIK